MCRPKHKKICLVTWLGTGNFGTFLQAYALSDKLGSLGYSVTVPEVCSFVYGMKRICGIASSPSSAVSRNLSLFDRIAGRIVIPSRLFLPFLNFGYDIFISGSDQIWNTNFRYSPENFLDFTCDGKRRISYASSIGASSFSPCSEPEVTRLLQRYAAISLRERTGVDAVRSLTGRPDIEKVADPVFLLSPEEWSGFSEFPSGAPDGEYAVCYFVGKSEEYAEVLESQRDLHPSYRFICVPSVENGVPDLPGLEMVPNLSAAEFLGLLKGASLVITDSFHASAFSVIFDRNLCVLKRFRDVDKASQNSRLDDFFEEYAPGGYYPYTHASGSYRTDNMELLRRKSMDFLKKALENG